MTCSAITVMLEVVLLAPSWFGVLLKLPATDRDPQYNPTNVLHLDCTVAEIREIGPYGPLSGVHLTISVEGKSVDVYLGPTSFVTPFQSLFSKGSRIQIVGSKTKLESSEVILAREIRRDVSTLYLRDKEGRPLWDRR